jgi:hypothetical protein
MRAVGSFAIAVNCRHYVHKIDRLNLVSQNVDWEFTE